MAGYVPMLLYMNLKYLPQCAKPRLFNIVMMSIGAVIYMSFAVYTIWSKVVSMFA